MGHPLHLLLIEDSEDDARLLLRTLTRGGYDVQYERVETAAALQLALDQGSWQVIISDYSLPMFDAPSALALVRAHNLDIPFLIVSGTITEDAAVTSLKAGAHDFITKGRMARLIPAIERELREVEERRARRLAEHALQQSEERYRSLVETSPDAILLTDLDGTIVFCNRQAARLCGFPTIEDLLWTSLTALVIPDDQPRIRADIERTARESRIATVEYTLRRHDAPPFPAECTISAVQQVGQQPTGFVAVLRDISERARAAAQITRQIAHLGALRAIDMAITASLDLRVTLNVCLDQITSQLKVDAAAILQLDPHTQFLHYVAGRGFDTPTIKRVWMRLGSGLAGRVAYERHMVSIPDVRTDPEWAEHIVYGDDAFVAYFGMPLVAKGQINGVLEIFHRAPLQPDTDWLDFFETLAGQVAIAIDNAVLFDDLQHSHTDLALAYDTTLEGWAQALDLRDKETEGHSRRVTELTMELAQALGIRSAELAHIRRGALLHDIGKLGIPDSVLLKPGPLTDAEWAIMRNHPVYAYQWLANIAFLRPALEIPYCHHEKWDGSGYPRGLRGEQIPLPARIFAMVDVWDAMRSNRPYRQALPVDAVLDHIEGLAGTHFDPAVVVVFLEMMRAKAGGKAREIGKSAQRE
jgi:PAS domain S-box-containing protein